MTIFLQYEELGFSPFLQKSFLHVVR